MDNLTHSLVGALIGQAGLKKKTGLAMPALIIGANLPDVDAACFFWLDGVEHLGFRRGITHGPPAMVLLPLILAGLLWGFDRWQARRGTRPERRLPVSFKWLFLLSFIACLTHPALDWLNVYGIRLLEPFSSRWFYGDTLFIIDVWLWALMGFATWFSLRREKRGGEWMKPARWAIAVALAYIGFNGGITYLAETSKGTMAVPYPIVAIGSPPPLAFWVRERIIQTDDGRWYSTSWTGKDIGYGYKAPDAVLCRMPENAAEQSSGAAAFLLWSRTPFAEMAEDGSVILRDARFYQPLSEDRFSVALPDVQCEELPAP
ncbi:metal-dependent hydrolase [Qipengyuania qiaonensis]|uniref:Metal-dependent hydrolase n=1 Tax=Qipengyuania qiaonensis TaxID=2867240 RepID=A0ABS7J1H3_9SPHN|nr:metal-dependent hydrolase [Qipengyuania qiaonensis]MBX7481112.1 metal-dependent hydrolase [Qipengyuania qiaonensis]